MKHQTFPEDPCATPLRENPSSQDRKKLAGPSKLVFPMSTVNARLDRSPWPIKTGDSPDDHF